MSEILQACENTFGNPEVLAIVVAAAVYGVFVGAIPGLTATMAVGLFVPLAYWLDPVPALAAVVTMEACAIFAGDIPNALLRIPGTPSSAAYVDDAYFYTRRGQSDRPLGVCLLFSVVGGLMGAGVLILLGHRLAQFASAFSVAEYFWLYVLGLSCAVVVSRGSLAKATLAMLLGLLCSTVGLSAVHTQARFTFGQSELFQGINFIPAMIGLFGVSEVLRNMLVPDESHAVTDGGPGIDLPGDSHSPGRRGLLWRVIVGPVDAVLEPARRLLFQRIPQMFRSATIGVLIGMLPGAGADIAAWVSLGVSKRFSKHPEEYGRGSLAGISDATTANSAALAAAWIPALVFGIPGDSVTAIIIGVLLMKNITPGPQIFETQAVVVYSLYFIFILANLVLIPVGMLAIKAGGYVVRVPRRVLLPVILLLCVIGAFAINASYFDVGIMLSMGLIGFLLERRQIPLGPVVLGIVLGGPLEERLIQTVTGADGSLIALVDRPVAAGLGLLCLALWVSALVGKVLDGKRGAAEKTENKD